MSGTLITLDCGCEVEISMVRISTESQTEYPGGDIRVLCEEHLKPLNTIKMLTEAFRQYHKEQSTGRGS